MTKRRGVTIIELGSGQPLVLVPGIQGRWEWMRPAVAALARRFRVITFSLLGEPGAGPAPGRFDDHLGQVSAALDSRGLDSAIVCGVSYGGLIALRFAAVSPERVARLVLVSTPSPRWEPNARGWRDSNAPRAAALPFLAGAPRRMAREIAAAIPDWPERFRLAAGYLGSVAANPSSPVRMARRVRCLAGQDFVADARRVEAPSLVVTGEPRLDRVVPVAGTREYLDLLPRATAVTLERTGHIGIVTRPEAFAELVHGWSEDARTRDAAERL